MRRAPPRAVSRCGLVSAADYLPRAPSERLLSVATTSTQAMAIRRTMPARCSRMLGKRAPRLERLAFSVLALGDSSLSDCEIARPAPDARRAPDESATSI